jgi:hypothetical protein
MFYNIFTINVLYSTITHFKGSNMCAYPLNIVLGNATDSPFVNK